MSPYAATWYARENPGFSYCCECGLAITGQSEKGLATLIRRHKQNGTIHSIWEKGETIMPVPHGIISTSEGPVDSEEANAISTEAVEETQEEQVQEEVDATEQEVVGSDSEQQE